MKLIVKNDFIFLEKPIQISLSNISSPFGIEKKYNDYIVKLSLNNENYIMFKNIEDEMISELIKIDSEYELKTQINIYNNFKSLITKLFIVKNNIITEFLDNNSNIIGIDDFKKKTKLDLIITVDKFWIKNKICYYKWKILYMKKK